MIWGSPNKKSYSNFYNEFNVIMTQVEEESTLSINYDVLNTYSNLKVTYYQISKESFYN